jgi:hypothetical protein
MSGMHVLRGGAPVEVSAYDAAWLSRAGEVRRPLTDAADVAFEDVREAVVAHGADQRTMERAMRNPTSSTWKLGWLRRRAEARQLQCSSNQPPPRSTR